MPDKHKPQKADTKQASVFIAVMSVIGLTTCFVVSQLEKKADIPIYLYAIFGGGILGTDNVLKFLKAVFRINDK